MRLHFILVRLGLTCHTVFGLLHCNKILKQYLTDSICGFKVGLSLLYFDKEIVYFPFF